MTPISMKTNTKPRDATKKPKQGGLSRSSSSPGTDVDRMFRAFCDRTRLRILCLLSKHEMCVGDLVEILGSPQPTVSRHLKYLRDSGLVTVRRTRNWVHYSLVRPKSVFHERLLECTQACFAEVPEIKKDAARAEKVFASGGCCPLE